MTHLSRRQLLAVSAAFAFGRPAVAEVLPQVHVVKDANCGCCTAWIEHLRADGFPVSFEEADPDALAALKVQLGVPADLTSCHTARVEGYFVEGHVPAADLRRLLVERPEALGLTVPGMPYGSPGMGPETEREAYDVRLVLPDGTTTVFAHYDAA